MNYSPNGCPTKNLTEKRLFTKSLNFSLLWGHGKGNENL